MERELGSCSPVISAQALAAILLDNKRLFTFYTFLKLFPAFYKPGMMRKESRALEQGRSK